MTAPDIFIEMPYRLFEHAHGLTCADCRRLIGQGQPYVSRLYGFHADATPLCELVCVYCGTPPVEAALLAAAPAPTEY